VSNPCQRTNAASAATSPSRIYRRIDRLTEAGLLDERAERDPAGHHRRVYECRLEEDSVAFDDAELRLELVRSRSSDSASWMATGTPRARSASAAAIPVGPAPATRTRASPWPSFEPIPTAPTTGADLRATVSNTRSRLRALERLGEAKETRGET